MKHLYHLNWDKSVAKNQDDHFKIISQISSDEQKVNFTNSLLHQKRSMTKNFTPQPRMAFSATAGALIPRPI
jgi:hypothetical protein